MDSRARNASAAERVYDDFEPSIDWAREAAADTLLIYIPGFRKEQLKVQVTSTRNLRVSGERQISGNKWSRFRKEISISSNYDANEISAKFEKGILFVKLPKIIVPARSQQEKEQTSVEASKPQEKAQQAPVQVPKPDQKTPQEKAKSLAEVAIAKAPPPVQQMMHPPAGASKPDQKPSQGRDKPLVADAKPGKPRIEAEGQGQKDGVANGNGATEKAPMKEKEESKYEGKEQSNGRAEARKVITAAGTSAEHEKLGDQSVPDGGKLEKGKTAAVLVATKNGKFAARNYKQVIGGLAMELKKPRTIINLVLAILSVVVLALYAMNAIKSLTKSEN